MDASGGPSPYSVGSASIPWSRVAANKLLLVIPGVVVGMRDHALREALVVAGGRCVVVAEYHPNSRPNLQPGGGLAISLW